MNYNLLKNVIFDQRDFLRNYPIVERDYDFEKDVRYVLVGLRRAGKSTLLYKQAQDLVSGGVEWEQIFYINFEDDRLAEFSVEDFNDILAVQSELTDKKAYFFFDEIQNSNGWEKFVRRLADSKEQVYVTGSNAKMLSGEMETILGGRYISKFVTPYSFREYLRAKKIDSSEEAIYTTKKCGKIRAAFYEYICDGGFPESLMYQNKREYVSSIFQKIMLGDIAVRNAIRNVNSLRIMLKKIAESVTSEISFSKIHNLLKTIGVSISKDTVIDYVGYSKDAYLIFTIKNYFSKFTEKESNPKYYFWDNGLLHLFVDKNDTSLLENLAAINLSLRYPDDVYFLKSNATGIDIDFFVASTKTAIQVAWSLDAYSKEREIQNLLKLKKHFSEAENFLILTSENEEEIEADGIKISVVPMYKWLLQKN